MEKVLNLATFGVVIGIVVVAAQRFWPTAATTAEATISREVGIDFTRAARTLLVVVQEEC